MSKSRSAYNWRGTPKDRGHWERNSRETRHNSDRKVKSLSRPSKKGGRVWGLGLCAKGGRETLGGGSDLVVFKGDKRLCPSPPAVAGGVEGKSSCK